MGVLGGRTVGVLSVERRIPTRAGLVIGTCKLDTLEPDD